MPDPQRRFSERTLSEWQDVFQSSPREEDRYRALQAIVSMAEGSEAVRWMRRGLDDTDSSVRATAARWLSHQVGQMPQPGAEADWAGIFALWQHLLHDSDPDVRFESARGLVLRDASDQAATRVLLSFLSDGAAQPLMLAGVLKVLAQGAGTLESPAVDWPKLLQHEQAEVREQSVRALGLRGVRSMASALSLLPLLDDEEPFVREEAAQALGRMGMTSPTIVAALSAAATDEDGPAAAAAQAALDRLGNAPSSSRG